MIYFIFFIVCILAVLLTLFSPDIPVSQLKKRWANTHSQFLEIDGVNIHYQDIGEKELPTVVMVHGLSSSLHTWDKLVDSLTGNYRLIRLDLPGFGLTGPWVNSTDYSAQHYQHFFQRFINQLNLERYTLIGNSFGGELIWRQANLAPNKVNGLILINATTRPAPFKNWLLAWKLAYLPISRWLCRYFLPHYVITKTLKQVVACPSSITKPMVQCYKQLALRAGNRQALSYFLHQYSHDDTIFEYPQITSPTLILWGEKDQLLPEHFAHDFSNSLSNFNLKWLPKLGHIPHEESPQTVNPIIRKFLDDINNQYS